MADETTLYYDGAMASIAALQTTCNTDEMNLERNLQSLDTVLNSGKKVTEAVYKATDPDKLGGLTIKEGTEGGAFTGKAYILTQPKNVVVSR
jgi:hypothetical protein